MQTGDDQTGNVPGGLGPEAYSTSPDRVGAYPIIRPTSVNVDGLDFPIAGIEDRPARMDFTTYTRPMRMWRALTGDHGLVPVPLQAPGLTGGQRSWSAWNPRTLRNIPTSSWDEQQAAAGG
jgi:hypothetical protein